MPALEQDPTRLMLVGDLNKAMGLAVEMVRGSAASIAIGAADHQALENWRRTVSELVVVDVAINPVSYTHLTLPTN